MNVRKNIYNTVLNRLTELDIYKWIDLYKGQINSKDSYPTGFPCAFISIRSIPYEDMTLGVKEGNLTLDVYLFFNKGGDTFYGAEDKDNSLNILDWVDDTINKIECTQSELFTELSQTDEEDLTERYKQPAYKITFNATIYKKMTNNYVPN